MNFVNLTGKRIGKLVVLGHHSNMNRRAHWNCKCDCGNERVISGKFLRPNGAISCGCIKKRRKERSIPHWWSYYNLAYKNVKRHLKFTDSVMTFEEFLEFVAINKCHYCKCDIQWPTHRLKGDNYTGKYQLDRKNNSIGYTKDNCVVCCTQCNFIKGSHLTYDEMMALSDGLKRIREMRKAGNQDVILNCPP